MSAKTFALLVVSLLLSAASARAALAVDVELTVADSANVARQGEPVTSGIPFAKGAVKDVSALAVRVAGKPVPAQFIKTVPWSDGSVRWALMDCQVDVPAGGKVALTVGDKGGNVAPANPVKVVDGADAVTVSTGPLRFAVNKKKFNLFQSLTVDGKVVLAPTSRGLVLVTSSGADALAADGAVTEVTVEQAGPMRAIVCVRGKFPTIAKDLLTYTVRITAYAGKKFVTVRTWLECQGNYGYVGQTEWVNFKGLSMEFALNLGGGVSAECEGVTAADKLVVEQRCPGGDSKSFAYTVTRGDKELTKGDRTDGVVALSGPGGKCNAAVRYFWENYEKAIELDGKTLRLWPADGQWPRSTARGARVMGEFKEYRKPGQYALPGGVHKGYATILDFSGRDAKASSATLSAALFAQAAPAYYASTEAAPGWFAPADFASGKAAYDKQVARWNTQAANAYTRTSPSSIWKARDGGADGRGYWYGWMDFGDNLWGEGDSSLHYDWPWIMLLDFLRTGDRAAFDLGETMIFHRVDVDQIWSERTDKLFNGLTRFERSAVDTHGDVDGGHSKPITTHFWLVGPVLHYMLTGDPKSYECALRGGLGIERRQVADYKDKPRAEGQTRASTWAILNLCALNDLTADKKYLDDALILFNNHIAMQWKQEGPFLVKNNALMYYYGTQPLCELAEHTGDANVMKLLKEGCEKDFAKSGISEMYDEWPVFLSNVYAYVGYKTKNADYLAKAEELFCTYTAPGWPNAYTERGAWTKETGKFIRNGHILQYVEWKLKQ